MNLGIRPQYRLSHSLGNKTHVLDCYSAFMSRMILWLLIETQYFPNTGEEKCAISDSVEEKKVYTCVHNRKFEICNISFKQNVD